MRKIFAKNSSVNSGAYLAVDVGGTKLAVGVVTPDGELVSRVQAPTPKAGVWDALGGLIESQLCATDLEIVACGVGAGGPMSADGDSVSTLHIGEWRGFNLRQHLRKIIHCDTYIYNDAQALVLGEHWRGAAAGVSNVIGMVVSTGVGGGVICDGKLLRGRLGNAGHIGHVIVEPDGRACACGSRGCLEAHASGLSIAAITGSPAAQATPDVVAHVGELVGRALASVAAVVDSQLAVIGGSVALGFGAPFFAAAQREIDARSGLDFIKGFRVVPVGLGDEAPLIGAAAVARHGRNLAGKVA